MYPTTFRRPRQPEIVKLRGLTRFYSESRVATLPELGIDFTKILGRLRLAKKGSVNTGWRNASFHSCADYMALEEFQRGIERSLTTAREKRTGMQSRVIRRN
jgi:hypothetical protein